ncbi:tRNA (adenosine(37)-N6)-dimethylallyltransferase MiaA [Lampropedia puyangensis]|uniref:tRNA dimethylallyltransferase n=1 Tax=Lampropedia puyangensis TaxID=1330072 RepID=A0A4S8FGL3_9BURK|nr:tRNA (adenosine(37)-N6)-dimethylallyltransferase MiaA [Lampropedia puyangensis]THU05022.1 tRNA (adenosine(37)-N6)-dimethylallyltransferase MiaA [Lampropedia puyangensis]
MSNSLTSPENGLLSKPFFVLTGPTACGKSALALELAKALQADSAVELISVDSALVYKGMDIGTAKPTAQELAQVPHHLIDIREPDQPYSAANFVRDCELAVDGILARGAFPILVGGTMLYLHAMLNGLDPLPQADAPVRAQLEARAQQQGWPAMHAWLAEVDPETAQRLAPRDAQRIQRALEVWLVSGEPLSQLQQRSQRDLSWQNEWIAQRLLSLEPNERSWLHARTDQRFDAMVRDGFLAEVDRLRANPKLHAQLPAIRAVGYRQAWQMRDGVVPEHEWIAQAQAATRQLAKRQITWLRSMPTRQVLACDCLTLPQLVDRALPMVRQIMATG